MKKNKFFDYFVVPLMILFLVLLCFGLFRSFNLTRTNVNQNNEQETTKYTVTFMVDDTVYATQQVNSGSCATAPTPPTDDYYSFLGWKLYSDGNGVIIDPDFVDLNTCIITSNTIFKGWWSSPSIDDDEDEEDSTSDDEDEETPTPIVIFQFGYCDSDFNFLSMETYYLYEEISIIDWFYSAFNIQLLVNDLEGFLYYYDEDEVLWELLHFDGELSDGWEYVYSGDFMNGYVYGLSYS